MKKVGVVLCGCGQLDGSEIHEATMVLLALAQNSVAYEGLAPNRQQYQVVNHVTNKSMPNQERSMLIEAARIMRGNIKSFMDADLEDYDALIFPGGNGAANNFFSLARDGENYRVDEDVLAVARDFREIDKPMGFICIAPMMIPFIYPQGVKMTIGNDTSMAAIVASKGAQHIDCPVNEIVIDKANKVVTTPAYMLAKNIAEVHVGVSKLVNAILSFY